VVFKGLIATASAVALMAAPTVAAAQTAAPTVAAQSARALAPAAEEVEGSELRGGFVIPLVAIILILLGLCIATDVCGKKKGPPVSP
jgi:hypothetical protein